MSARLWSVTWWDIGVWSASHHHLGCYRAVKRLNYIGSIRKLHPDILSEFVFDLTQLLQTDDGMKTLEESTVS
jgi:hypothetical protein